MFALQGCCLHSAKWLVWTGFDYGDLGEQALNIEAHQQVMLIQLSTLDLLNEVSDVAAGRAIQ